ncbi:tyrosine-type recombinase/integrase [Dasania sp. GY-MA-18]|uniref:Site-specific integrase n=1 Tax=Dasania phycosphaerae TaxID=2950436 RepID=A0A9J6RGU6_9GAMM|nr:MULTISPECIES: site-specific integrase [Dasania]MCR8921134.1 tyrosine-type recombinase/integrase [Dasania sp. GY-MA-18]MCZ0863562.1 site-specific integrase [Dasania phycosphaerae]MCZ0867290.1 site-specific integrase [Dasania phycosphaerae]
MSKRNTMPGLRLKGDIWHIEKRCKHAEGGWLRESTGTASRIEAEEYLIQRLANVRQETERRSLAIYTFEEAALRYLEDIAHKSSAVAAAIHLDQMLPFIGHLPLEQIHDGTLKLFIDNEAKRDLAPKSINNALVVITAILNRAARVWRHDDGRPWLRQAPPKITRLSTKGRQAKAYPLSWAEQDTLFKILPRHLADAALYAVHTGCRELEVCMLRWDWEIFVQDLGVSVFVLPETITKNGTERIVILNSVSGSVIEARRGIDPHYVFTYRGRPMKRLHSSGWRHAWKKAGLPTHAGVLKGVHNLRHTFGRRLRAAGVPLETRKALLGHANGDITTHYSAAEIDELLTATEKVVSRGIAQTPTLSLVHKNAQMRNVGKVSEENKKGHPKAAF